MIQVTYMYIYTTFRHNRHLNLIALYCCVPHFHACEQVKITRWSSGVGVVKKSPSEFLEQCNRSSTTHPIADRVISTYMHENVTKKQFESNAQLMSKKNVRSCLRLQFVDIVFFDEDISLCCRAMTSTSIRIVIMSKSSVYIYK